MKKVLFVAHGFPPIGGVGVQRSTKFVKYLPENGWIPTVVASQPLRGGLVDNSLLDEIPPEVIVERVRGHELPSWLPWRVRHRFARWVLTVDDHLGWLPAAVARARDVLARDDYSAIYSTSAPYTGHLVARTLHRDTGLPWVADFRDPWVDHENIYFPTRWHRGLCIRLERSILNESQRTIIVGARMKQDMQKRYPNLLDDRIAVIPNGFDPADLELVEPAEKPDGEFTVTYTGSFYGQRQSIRNYLLALRRLLDAKSIAPGRIKTRLVGAPSREARQLIESLGLSDSVAQIGFVSHQEAVSYQLGTDLLLLIVGDIPRSSAVLQGKLYEYLAANRPILALVPSGASAELIREAQAGITVHPDDIDGISRALSNMYDSWREGELNISIRPDVVSRFDRRMQAKQLASLLDQLTS